METASSQALKIDQDKIAVRRSIDLLLHLLSDYIPRSAFRDAERTLYEAFEKDGIELTNKMMRKDGMVRRAAPIIKYLVGKTDDQARAYIKSKGWKASVVGAGQGVKEP